MRCPIGYALRAVARVSISLSATTPQRTALWWAARRLTAYLGLAAGLFPWRSLPAPAAALVPGRVSVAPELVDTAAILKIKEEGFARSRVMEIASWLTDVHGPRLTGSPITRRAGDWALEQLTKWGLANPHYDWWGPFGRGWVNERTVAQVTAPVPFPVIAYPDAWSEGTRGMIHADVVLVPSTVLTAADFAPYRGKLRGKIVVNSPPLDETPLFAAPARRYTTEELDALANPYPLADPVMPQPSPAPPPQGGTPGALPGALPPEEIQQCLLEAGVAAILRPGRGTGGIVFSTGDDRARFPLAAPPAIPRVKLAAEHYGRIHRMLERGIPVRMDLEVKNTFSGRELNSFNLIAEIPGTDKADEVVMLGAHFDSWQAGTGATDNAAGSAVMMEAMRILKVTGVPLRRTVRIGLWTGEEQGVIGSREYVRAHFGDPGTMVLKSAHAKLSAYYNLDNGTGAIRGIYLQENAAAGPIFAQWMGILTSDSISVGHVAPGNTYATDHLAFDAVGLPGFQFIQDPIEYDSRTHHSSHDLYERLQPVDLKHNAVAVATFAYLTANREALLPRKTLPRPPIVADAAGAGGGEPSATAQPIDCPAK